jgi:hypothetical protein
MIPKFESSYIKTKDKKKLFNLFLESYDNEVVLSPTREMLKPYSNLILSSLDKNQVATRVGAVAEYILIKYYNWEKNGDIGNEKGYDAVDKEGKKHEIKSMSNETQTPYLAYDHLSKGGKYDILSILHFNEKRVSHIPSWEIIKFINENTLPGRKTKSLRLCFDDPLLTKLGKPRKKSLFLALFLKYEDKQFKF